MCAARRGGCGCRQHRALAPQRSWWEPRRDARQKIRVEAWCLSGEAMADVPLVPLEAPWLRKPSCAHACASGALPSYPAPGRSGAAAGPSGALSRHSPSLPASSSPLSSRRSRHFGASRVPRFVIETWSATWTGECAPGAARQNGRSLRPRKKCVAQGGAVHRPTAPPKEHIHQPASVPLPSRTPPPRTRFSYASTARDAEHP